MPENVPPEQRLFTLVMTLLASEQGLLREQIYQCVPGYSSDAEPSALEKKFERDKDTLRSLGIPIDVQDSPDAPGDNTKQRYRIKKDEYDLPADIEFSSEEVSLLRLAGSIWREATISKAAATAFLKLGSMGVAVDEPVLSSAPKIHTREASFGPLEEAIRERKVVRFDYLKPGDATSMTRRITPFHLGFHEGRWHLYGYDHVREATRIFLLSRITSKVQKDKDLQPAPFPDDAGDEIISQLQDRYLQNVATVKVQSRSVAATTLRRRMSADEKGMLSNGEINDETAINVHYTDLTAFAEELAGFGPEVQVLSPPELQQAVIGLLKIAVARNGGAA